MTKLTCSERRGVPGHESWKIREPYSPAEMESMFGPYLRENDLNGLSPRDVRLVETIESLRELLAETWSQAMSASACGEKFPCGCHSCKSLAEQIAQALGHSKSDAAEQSPIEPAMKEEKSEPAKLSLARRIERELNCCNAEAGSDTPDFILAQYLMTCLAAFDVAVRRRENWYGRGAKLTAKEPVSLDG
jgi:hypothetical protein